MLDTTPEARAVQRRVWERLGPEGRVRAALQMSEEMLRIGLAGIAARHPDLSHREHVRLLVERLHGVDIGSR